MRKQRHTAYTNCPVEATLDIIGGKWKSIILFRVLEETRRFNELRRLIPALTQRMLTNQLRELEHDGLIVRKVYAQVPPKVEYSISAFGKTLEPVLLALKLWAEKNMLPRMAASDLAKLEENAAPTRPKTTVPVKGTKQKSIPHKQL